MPYRILCTDGFSRAGLDALAAHEGIEVVFEKALSHEELLARIPEFDGLIVRSASEVSRDVIEAGANLKVVARAGVGTDNIDIAAATERGILVVNAPAGNTLSTAELAFSLLLAVARHIPQSAAAMSEGRWEKKKFQGHQLAYKTLGVIGLGRIGREVAARGQAFRMRVVGFDPYLSDEKAEAIGVEPRALPELLRESDFVTIHTPLTDETRDLIGAEQLRSMKPTAYLVNCARGGIVNEEALAAALREKVIAGAALDVYTEEPYAKPTFQGLENVILTPHLGASTVEAQEAVAEEAARAVAQFFAEGVSFNAVNLPGADAQRLAEFREQMLLAERVGSFASQLAGGEVGRITFRSTVRATKLVTLSAVRGVLARAVSDTVTFVNAAQMAGERGIGIVEEVHSEKGDLGDAIGVCIETKEGAAEVWGRLMADGTPKIVRLNDYAVDIDPVGSVLVIRNADVPGVIGRVATILGEHRVNIAEMQNVRHGKGKDALTVIGVDEPFTDEALAEIRADKAITDAKVIRL